MNPRSTPLALVVLTVLAGCSSPTASTPTQSPVVAADTPAASPTPAHPADFTFAADKLSSSPFQNPVLFTIPGMDQVKIANVTYSGDLTMDLYYPPDFDFNSPKPAVLFVFGVPDEEAILQVGSPFKEMGQYISWSQLVAASGMIAVTYDTGRAPFGATSDPIAYISANGPSLGIDTDRLCLWSGSAHSAAALRIITDTSRPYHSSLACGVFYYGDTILTKTLADDIPLFVVEAGQDTGDTNALIARFVEQAQMAGVAVEFVTYPDGAHGFETKQDTDETHDIVNKTLDFLKTHLLVE